MTRWTWTLALLAVAMSGCDSSPAIRSEDPPQAPLATEQPVYSTQTPPPAYKLEPGQTLTVPKNMTGVIASLKADLIALSVRFSELADVNAIRTGQIPNGSSFYGLQYVHDLKPWGKGGREATGPRPVEVRFVVHPRRELPRVAVEMQAPTKTYEAMALALWSQSYAGPGTTAGLDKELQAVLDRHVQMVAELERRAKAKGMYPVNAQEQ